MPRYGLWEIAYEGVPASCLLHVTYFYREVFLRQVYAYELRPG